MDQADLSAILEIDIPEPPAPAVLSISLPESDEVETGAEIGDEESLRALIGNAIGIGYRDAKGNLSERRITIRGLFPKREDIFVRAYCHERKAPRCFWVSRMTHVIDLHTGEVLEDAPAFFRGPRDAGEQEFTPEKVLKDCHDGLQILAFVARSDGVYDPVEQELLLEYTRDCCDYRAFDEGVVGAYVGRLHPDPDVVGRALQRFHPSQADSQQLRRLLRYLRRVIDADGVLHEREFYLARAICEFLGAS